MGVESFPIRWLRGLSGVVAGGMAMLALLVIATALVAKVKDFEGPGATSLTVHCVGAVVVIAAQVWADRRSGVQAVVSSLIVFIVTAAVLWTQWWS